MEKEIKQLLRSAKGMLGAYNREIIEALKEDPNFAIDTFVKLREKQVNRIVLLEELKKNFKD